jgi:hypothetical protein
MTTALDRRAGEAAAAVRAAVAHLEPPPGELPGPARRRWPALAAAVALAAAAVAGAVLVERNVDRDVVAGPTGPLPRLVVGDVPEGMSATGATEVPGPGSPASTFRLYGEGDADDPLRDGDVGIVVMSGDAGSFATPGGEVRVRGVQGTMGEDPDYGWSLTWREAGVGSVLIHSRSMSEAEVLGVAEALRREGDGLVLDQPPDSYRLVADLPGLPVLFGAGDDGSQVRYESADAARWLSVAVVAERPGAFDAIRWLGGRNASETAVRGHDAWYLPPSGGAAISTSMLGWREQPGVLVTVAGTGLSEDELRAVAESLRPATDGEWEELLASGSEEVTATNEDMSTLAEGPSWRYARDGDEGVCFEVVEAGFPSGTCYSDGPRLSEGAEQVEAGWWFHGRVSDDVVRIALQQGDRAPQLVDTVPVEGGGRAWATLLPDGGVTRIAALDAAGAELEQTTFDTGPRVEPPGSTTSTTAAGAGAEAP